MDGLDLDRYVNKLQCLYGRVGESNMSTLASGNLYQFPSTEWIDDILLWPPVDFPSLCAYFVEIHTGEAQGKQKS